MYIRIHYTILQCTVVNCSMTLIFLNPTLTEDFNCRVRDSDSAHAKEEQQLAGSTRNLPLQN